jgi:hypothetical protein
MKHSIMKMVPVFKMYRCLHMQRKYKVIQRLMQFLVLIQLLGYWEEAMYVIIFHILYFITIAILLPENCQTLIIKKLLRIKIELNKNFSLQVKC